MSACVECGFRYDEMPPAGIGAAVVDGVVAFVTLLSGPGLATRPRPGVWSPIEYACHLRDMLLVQRERVLLARRESRPYAVPMGRDERAEHEGYREQVPADVARQLVDAAKLFANVLGRLPAEAWGRTLLYTYPEPAERPLTWVAAHTLHEVRHHTMDIRR